MSPDTPFSPGATHDPQDPHDFDQELLILFDAYVHGDIGRRAFLDRAAMFAVGGVTAAMLLDQLSPKFREAQVVRPQDARIQQEYIEFDSPDGYGRGRGYFVRPAGATGPLPGILVIHENRGLNPHIEDVARRSITSWPLRRMRCSPSAGTRIRKTQREHCSGITIRPGRGRTSSRQRLSCAHARNARVASVPWGSATAVAW
jgi:hypothetical protein